MPGETLSRMNETGAKSGAVWSLRGLVVASIEHRLLQTELTDDQENALRDFLDSRTQLTDADILNVIRLVMATPSYQVT